MFGILYTFDNNEHEFQKFNFSLQSLLKNTPQMDDIEINVLLPKNNQHIQDILKIYDKIKFIYNEDVDSNIRQVYNNFKNKGRWGTQVFFKFYIFIKDFYHKYDKCVYLDADIVIRKDIHLLFNQQFNNKSLIMLAEEFTDYKKFVNSFRKDLQAYEWVNRNSFLNSPTGIDENFRNRKFIYGNSGVIFFNSKNGDKIDIFNKIVEISKKNNEVLYVDQDILNIFLSIEQNEGLFQSMPEKYNRRWNFKDEDVIRHYTGNRKMEL